MGMYDEYVKRGIALPQVHPQQPDRSPCNPRSPLNRLDPADYTSFAFRKMIVYPQVLGADQVAKTEDEHSFFVDVDEDETDIGAAIAEEAGFPALGQKRFRHQ